MNDAASAIAEKLCSIALDTKDPAFSSTILSNHLVYDLVFDASTPASIFRVSRTCRIAHAAVRSYCTRAFSVHKLLSRYFDDPLAFRNLQARTGTLISGSTALQFFDRVTYELSDLDLYVPFVHKREVGEWVLQQGYTFKPSRSQCSTFGATVEEKREFVDDGTYYFMRGVSYLLTFTKPLPNHPDIELKLQLIVASRSPMEVILYFHSTVVLNVIAWDAAYSLYPCSTFEDRASLFLRDKASIEKAIVDKYIARGWTFKSHLPFSRGIRDIALTSVPRWIGDGHSWVIQLETAGIVFPPPINRLSRALTRDPSFVTCWIVEPNGERGGSSIGFEMTAKETGLFHQYPVLGWQLQDALDLIHSQWDAKPAVTVSPDVKIREYYDQQLIEVAERRQWQPPHKVMRVLF